MSKTESACRLYGFCPFIPVLAGVFILALSLDSAFSAEAAAQALKSIAGSRDYVELLPAQGFKIDLRYATKNNFVGQNLYGDFNRAFLHREAAEKLMKAQADLKIRDPHLHLHIFDALRPRSVQIRMWDKVKGTDGEKYVGNPEKGSVHNFGFAVDITISDSKGRELDMGTPFDAFTPLSQPKLEEAFLVEGKLTARQIENRRLLRGVMERAGFLQLPSEWWHFDALPASEVRAKYKVVE